MSSPCVGLDVGSTTVKGVVFDGSERCVAYRRHHGALAAAAAALLGELLPADRHVALALTGSGGRLLAERLRTPYVHEVAAVTDAVADRHPGANAFVDLGGQDAKMVLFDRDPGGALRRADSSMNDRCAAGTGATLDRCLLRLGPDAVLADARYDPARIRPLSSKCGVFAETDLVNWARSGVPPEELLGSVADAIVLQCLAVLARGRVPRSPVVLLGGPHVHFPALAEAWRHHLGRLWRERDEPVAPEPIAVPEDALYYAAFGAAARAASSADRPGPPHAREAILAALAGPEPSASIERLDRPFAGAVDRAPRHAPRAIRPGRRSTGGSSAERDPAFRGVAVGIDAGSTAMKAVAIEAEGTLLASAACRSDDPVANARAVLARLGAKLAEIGAAADVRAVGATGYAAPLVTSLVDADAHPVETAAHACSARAFFPDADVVCDVGGQDIKVLVLRLDGQIRDFRISSQCNAGIGMVLETTARELGVPLASFAAEAFTSRRAPRFGDGCVVFLDADRVTFQRQAFSRGEILAGLARALPRVVWEQIMGGVPPASLGRVFVLQGGVQRNPAAVQAQREYLERAVPGARVVVHPFPAEAGAIGAALAAMEARPFGPPRPLAVARGAGFVAIRSDESTRCRLCPSACPRTVVEVAPPGGEVVQHVTGFACDEGSTLRPQPGAASRARRRKARRAPNLLGEETRRLFAIDNTTAPLRAPSRRFRIGIPRVLSMYRAAPFFRGYLQALGVEPRDVIFSPPTSDRLWREGLGHGASDPCFPVKVVLAHAHHLLGRVHDRGAPLDVLFVPSFTHALTPVRHAVDCASCPVVAASPALVRSALGQAGGELARRGIALVDGPVTITDAALLSEQMFAALGDRLGATRGESDAAIARGFRAMRAVDDELQAGARRVLDRVAREVTAWAALVLGRPYHADPGLNHRLGEELQALGLPALSIRSLPRDEAWLSALLAPDLASGRLRDPFDVRDLAPECGNSGSSERLWAARIAARHPRVAVIDVSSFKCAQDPAMQAPVRALLQSESVPVCTLHDLDETRPTTSLRLRLRTLAHALAERGFRPAPVGEVDA